MFNKITNFLASTKFALVLLAVILLSCVVGVLLPAGLGKEAVFTSLWFNLLLVLLVINIVFCITKRTRILRLSQAGTTIFHLGLVLLFIGVVYDQLFFFEGAIRLTEGETLNCAERASYDRIRKGRFFQASRLNELGEIYFHKFHTPPYMVEGKERGAANEIAVGEDFKTRRTHVVYVTRPLQYKGFEFLRDNKDGYSTLFVLRDRQGKVIYGAFAPLQSIRQKDGTYLYRSGRATLPESFNFPQDPRIPAVLKLYAVFRPNKIEKRSGEVSFQVWEANARPEDRPEELFNGKAAFGERVKVGNYLLSMDEVRYWTSINVIYRPGLGVIFGSFWIAFGGLILNIILKMAKPVRKDAVLTPLSVKVSEKVNIENTEVKTC